MYMQNFIENILDGKKSKRSTVDMLYKQPLKDEDGDNPTIPIIDPNYAHYIDLLYLPSDNGLKYCLTITDQGSRYVGATALEDRTVSDIIKAMKVIYRKSKFLQIPSITISDRGKEFLGNFESEIKRMGIQEHKLIKAGRHRSNLVERKNQTIGKIISRILTQVQLTSGNPSSKWVEFLPIIINAINEKVDEKNIKPKPMEDVKPFTFNPKHKKIKLLKEGDRVRVALDNPIDVVGNKLHGTFRTGDIRWNPEIRTVMYMYMKVDQPIMYFLNGKHKMNDKYVEPVGYTFNQLQKVSVQEKDPETEMPLYDNEFDREEVQKITERGLNDDNEMMYLVKFKKVRQAVWIDRDSLVRDLGSSFVTKLDKAFDKKNAN